MTKTTENSARRTLTPREAEGLVREQASSGVSLAAFARQRGIPAYRLYEARNRLARRRREAPSSNDFQPLHVVDTVQEGGAPVELVLPAGLLIRVGRDFDEVAMRRLLGVLVSC